MSEIQEITDALVEFRNKRDWEKFHNAKDLSIAISIEASELMEEFLWKSPQQADQQKIREELADIFIYAFLIAEKYKFDIKDIIYNKIQLNDKKYPVKKSKGNAKKYNKLDN